ncbi:MAG: hypothetical protein RQ936_12560 [Gammaproteobacteria bacterium]|nr:hypothetical protein [Gammaproteobacteria bacterium]
MGISDAIAARLKRITRGIDTIISKYARLYTAFVSIVALLGYALVLLFPILVITAAINIYQILLIYEAIDWKTAAIWSVVLVLSALFSYRSLQIKATPPVGLTLAKDKVPDIFRLTQHFQSHFKRPTIHRVVITPNYEVDIVKVPKWALPVWSTNALIIGLPVLLCLSPKQFECLLASRIGQFSKRHNLITNWLYQLRAIWKQYAIAYGKLKYPDSYLLKWFYAAYASFYNSVSVHTARRDKLYADSYAMELFTHEDVREMITAEMTYQLYLQKRFWPVINKMASAETKTPLTPYRNIASSIHTNVEDKKLTSLMHVALKSEPARKSPMPSLKQRLKNIGHDTPYMTEITEEAAANKYLGTSVNNVIKLIDMLWAKDNKSRQKPAKE